MQKSMKYEKEETDENEEVMSGSIPCALLRGARASIAESGSVTSVGLHMTNVARKQHHLFFARQSFIIISIVRSDFG